MTQAISDRVAELDWTALGQELDERGFAQTPPLLSPAECRDLGGLYETGTFRSTVTMARHGFGRGEYKYLDYPLPPVIDGLREAMYRPLAAVANRWAEWQARAERYPDELPDFLERCHAAGQSRATPLILRYGPDDWNALHQDIYGEVAFPLQVVTVLDRPGHDFEGGEFVLVEQRPRAQSRAHVCALRQGAFLIFTTRERPARGRRGYYRAPGRHGVSTVSSGRRTTLGIIFHDAR
jgi:uncharacterized protein